jgi:hypothetical protein
LVSSLLLANNQQPNQTNNLYQLLELVWKQVIPLKALLFLHQSLPTVVSQRIAAVAQIIPDIQYSQSTSKSKCDSICSFTTIMNFNYYDFLGVRPNADSTEINKSWKQLSIIIHPDKSNGRTTHLQQHLNTAKQILLGKFCCDCSIRILYYLFADFLSLFLTLFIQTRTNANSMIGN